jgi:hypothetical protein
LFHSARWKAYLKYLRSKDNADKDGSDDPDKVIYHIFHSQMLWFTRDEANGHRDDAEKHLKRCDALMKDCSTMNDALEATLANTPKPSEVLDWDTIWW